MARTGKGFEKHYSDSSFWDKVKGYAKAAGRDVIEKALWLYYAMQSPECPAWAKAVIVGALGYFIFPIDAIPDGLVPIGYTDDLVVLTLAVAAVSMHITPEVKRHAAEKLKDWFG